MSVDIVLQVGKSIDKVSMKSVQTSLELCGLRAVTQLDNYSIGHTIQCYT